MPGLIYTVPTVFDPAEYESSTDGTNTTYVSRQTGVSVSIDTATGATESVLVPIPPEYCMVPGDYIASDNGAYVAIVQDDGLFAIFHGSNPDNTSGQPLWVSQAGSFSNVLLGTNTYSWPAPVAPCYFALVGYQFNGYSPLDFGCFYQNPTNLKNAVHIIYPAPPPHWPESVVTYSDTSTTTTWSVQLQFYTGYTDPNLPYYADVASVWWKISDSGQFEIYAGTGPTDPSAKLLRQYGPTDPVTSCVITSIYYNTSNATFVPAGSGYKNIAMSSLEVNDSASPSNSVQWTGTATVEYSSGWSNSLSETYGTSTTVSAGVSTNELPFVDISGEISVTNYSEFTNTTEISGEQSWSMSFGYDIGFTVPPYTVMQGVAQIANGILTVPFTVTGLLTYASGATLPAIGHGTYTGNNCLTDAVFTVDIGYSVMTLKLDPAADYTGSFRLVIVSPLNNSVLFTSESSPLIEPGGSQSIDLASMRNLPANCFFVGGVQTRMYPLLTLSDGTSVKGDNIPVYQPSRGNSHVAVYDCFGHPETPTCVFNKNQSG